MENFLGKELEGKVLKWNYVARRGFGILKIEQFPQTAVLVHIGQLAKDIMQEHITQGTVCRFTVQKNRKGQYRGLNLTLLLDDVETENDKKQTLFEFSYIDSEAASMIDAKDVTQIKNSINFIRTLPDTAPTPSCDPLTHEKPGEDTKNVFVDTMKSFCTIQFSLLAADLYSNTKKGDEAHAHRVEANYHSAATFLLQPETSPFGLTLDVILELHRLTTDQLLDSAGILRHNRGARAGSFTFPPPSQVLPLLRTFLELFQSYIQSYFMKHTKGDHDLLDVVEFNDDTVRDACTLAGWMGYHFLKIHPFNDGNGRTCRLLINWVLKRCLSLPFGICLCPTPVQRSVYVAATRYSDSKLMSKYISQQCAVAWEEYFSMCTDAFKSAAMRTTSGIQSADCGGTRKQVAAEREEVLTAERVALRATCCLICMDDGPSISTLCCGQPMHFTCLSNWFITQRRNHSASVACPHCRCDISELQIDRIVPTVVPADENVQSDTTSSSDDDDTSSTVSDSSSVTSTVADDNDNDETSTTTMDADGNSDDETSTVADNNNHNSEDETSTTSVEIEPPRRPQCSIQHCHNILAGGCTNSRCARCCQQYAGVSCYRHGTHLPHADNANDDTSTTSMKSSSSSSDYSWSS